MQKFIQDLIQILQKYVYSIDEKNLNKKISIDVKYIFIILFTLITSCVTLNKVKHDENRKKISDNDFQNFNGDYSIFPKGELFRTLDLALLNDSPYTYDNKLDSNITLNLYGISLTKIKATLIVNNKIIKTKLLNGKIKDDYFHVQKSYKVKFWFIFNGLTIQKTRIGILNNNNLSVDTSTEGAGFLFFLPFGGSGGDIYGLEYAKIE